MNLQITEPNTRKGMKIDIEFQMRWLNEDDSNVNYHQHSNHVDTKSSSTSHQIQPKIV